MIHSIPELTSFKSLMFWLCLTPTLVGVAADDQDTWSVDRLAKESSHICLVRCKTVARVPNTEFFPQSLGEYLLVLEIQATLKGDERKTIRLQHFQYLPETNKIGNGPTFLYFGRSVFIASRNLKVGQRVEVDPGNNIQLVFLKENNETGFFEPTSGKRDAAYSSLGVKGLGIGSELELNAFR